MSNTTINSKSFALATPISGMVTASKKIGSIDLEKSHSGSEVYIRVNQSSDGWSGGAILAQGVFERAKFLTFVEEAFGVTIIDAKAPTIAQSSIKDHKSYSTLSLPSGGFYDSDDTDFASDDALARRVAAYRALREFENSRPAREAVEAVKAKITGVNVAGLTTEGLAQALVKAGLAPVSK